MMEVLALPCSSTHNGGVAQLVRARGSYPRRRWFKSSHRHHSPSPNLPRTGRKRVTGPRLDVDDLVSAARMVYEVLRPEGDAAR